MENYKNIVILLAGGSGSRFERTKPKQFVKVLGKTILEHTLDNINSIASINEIYLVCHSHYIKKVSQLANKYQKIKAVLPGGDNRAESIGKGLDAIVNSFEKTKVLIHDSVRPLISPMIVDQIIKLLDTHEFVQSVSNASTDIVFDNQFCHRDNIKFCSGPEAAHLGLLKKAYRLNPCNSVLQACSSITSNITTIDVNPENIKVTYSSDIIYLKKELKKRLSLHKI